MATMSHLSHDLVEEILSRVPICTLGAVRSTSKHWNALSKNQSFRKKHCGKAAKESLVIMNYDFRVCLMSVNLLQGTNNHSGTDGCLVDLSLKPIGKLNQVEISKVFHCDGLLLCVTKDNTRLVVWNPYLGTKKWFRPKNYPHVLSRCRYALGYDKNKNQRILMLLDRYDDNCKNKIVEYEIYNFYSSFSSEFGVMNADWYIPHCRQGLSLKGYIYFLARKRLEAEAEAEEITDWLLCFDFTSEGFGPRLDLPFYSCPSDSVILSSVREEQLAVLLMRGDTYEMGIWITTKIEANAVSWSKFLKVDMKALSGRYQFQCGSFFVDEKKKIAVVCGKDRGKMTDYTSYMVGEDGCYKEVALGESICLPFACSYVPSSVEIQKVRLIH